MSRERDSRIEDLERRFSELEHRLEDSPEKEAISLLHALIHADRRRQFTGQPAEGGVQPVPAGPGLEGIANLYKSAPAMEGNAESPGLPAGTPAPDFALRDAGDNQVSLGDFRGQPLVLVFYPLDWSPACSDQLSLYQSELDEFQKQGVQLVAVSVDSIYSHGAWAAVRQLDFPLLADFHPKGDVAKRYRVYRESDGFSERALFVVDGEGIIRYSYVSPQLHMVPSIYDLFEQLKGLASRPAPQPSR
jgi:peroxiredoxin